jgi:hypothetical protein
MPRDPVKRKASNQRYNESDKGKANQQRRWEKVAAANANGKAAQTAREAAVTAFVEQLRTCELLLRWLIIIVWCAEQLENKGAWRAVPLLLLLLQRPLGVLLVEPHALERSLLGESAAVEVKEHVGELLEELGLQHRQADDAAGGTPLRKGLWFGPCSRRRSGFSPRWTSALGAPCLW